jgi:hypothetical protein
MSKSLTDRPKKELADLARRRGVPRWDALTKDQLVVALSKPVAKPAKPAARVTRPPVKASKPAKPAAKAPAAKPVARPAPAKPPARPAAVANGTHKPGTNGTPKPAAPAVAAAPPAPKPPAAKPPAKPAAKPAPRLESVIPAEKDLSSKNPKGQPVKDRIFLMVPDPYWLHAHWELSFQSVQRAEAALGQDWYGAKPIIRLFDVTSMDTTSTAEAPIRDIPIHGGCNHWYIDVPQPPRSYRADIGYLSRRGVFHPLCRSNVVTPPKAGASEALDDNWQSELDEKAAERLLAMSTGFESAGGPSQLRELFDEQLKRTGKDSAFGTGAVLPDKLKKFAFTIDAELIVYGKTDPTAHVTLQNDPVKLRPDGTFVHRYKLTDGRQIIPAVAASSDGMEERTIVLAVERNTKYLDPMIHDLYGEN